MKQFKVKAKNSVYSVFADSEVEAVNKVKEVESKLADSFSNSLRISISSIDELSISKIVKTIKNDLARFGIKAVKKITNGKLYSVNNSLTFQVYAQDSWDETKFTWGSVTLSVEVNSSTMRKLVEQGGYALDKFFSEIKRKLKTYENKTIYEDKTLIDSNVDYSHISDAWKNGKIIDSHDTELKLLKSLESIVQKWRAWRNKYKSLFDLEEKYWRNWDGYRTSLGKDDPRKLKLLEQQMLKANQEVQPVINEWNRIAEGVMRQGGFREWEEGKIHKLEPETFPGSHLFSHDLDYILNHVKEVINYKRTHDSIKDSVASNIVSEVKKAYPKANVSTRIINKGYTMSGNSKTLISETQVRVKMGENSNVKSSDVEKFLNYLAAKNKSNNPNSDSYVEYYESSDMYIIYVTNWTEGVN